MNIFNSLGSNYDLNFVIKTLFLDNNQRYKKDLEKYLSEKFNGQTMLTYKGRQAIELALKILNLPKDSLVAINGFTCFAVYKAIADAGLKPLYLDIDEGDLNFSPLELEKAISKNPNIKVVIIQNTLGFSAKVEKIAEICKKNGIVLIEDLAHSVGAHYGNGLRAGSLGDFVVLSFSQDKLIDAVSGGALIRKGVKLIHPEGGIHWHPFSKQVDRFYPLFTFIIRKTYPYFFGKMFHTILKSFNLLSQPMNDSSSFIGIAPWYCKLAKEQLDNLEGNLNHRKKIAKIYADNISREVLSSHLVQEISNSTNLRFPIFINDRLGLTRFLKNKGIFVSDIWYDAPISPKKYMSKTNYNGECPKAEEISEKILNLPTHKNTSEEDALRISYFINQWLKQ
ncbi:DegT/DnrJ/EryC1/StrS aminotransferase family protein [Candidatus Daviesbacteria bacterium]|nr:DegT/DnrJ/EryC1/StrS aminotransferase family protein [Candidatus Daviesbacteria bacterium]